jgi:hypothetical protein
MPNDTPWMCATAGTDGKAYVVGGYGRSRRPDFTEVYNATSNQWTSLSAPPVAPADQVTLDNCSAATGPDGKIYSIGGGDVDGSDCFDPYAGVYAFSPRTSQWLADASLPISVGRAASVAAPNGLIYTFGGAMSSTLDCSPVSTAAVQVFSPGHAGGSWASGTPLPNARDGFAAVVGPDGRIYVIGGEYHHTKPVSGGVNDLDKPLATVYPYAIAANTWTQVASLPIAGDVVGADGRIYVVGAKGDMQLGFGPAYLAAYNVSTNTWSTLPAPPGGNLATGVGSNHSVIAINGADANATPAYTYGT